MRPTVKFLNEELIIKIIDEAIDVLTKLGVEIHNKLAFDTMSDNGANVEIQKNKVFYTRDLIEKSLKSSKSSFKLFDIFGK